MDKFKERPLSWSSISSFQYDKEKWYRSYILGEKQTSREMEFGSLIDKRIQEDLTFTPSLPRYDLMQYKMKVMFGDILLVGVPDGVELVDKKILADFKTGKKPWTQKRADETGQLTMYLLLLYITGKHKPEDFECRIHWLRTEDRGDFSVGLVDDTFKTFITRRTMQDILTFGAYIKKTYKEMEEFVEKHV